MRNNYDAIIIGSGAGGAPIAHTLALAGKTVLVLEKGPLIRPQKEASSTLSSFKRDELISDGPEQIIKIKEAANYGQSFFVSHVEPDLNDEPHVYRDKDQKDKVTLEGYTAQLVGGGTNLYGAVSLRFTDRDFNLKSFNSDRTLANDQHNDIRHEARDWPIDYQVLEPFYDKTERVIGINGTSSHQRKSFSATDTYQTPLTPNPLSEYAYKGMLKLGEVLDPDSPTVPYRTPLAVITENHALSKRVVPKDKESIKTSYVNRYGDPLGLKSSTYVALLSQLEDLPNFTLEANSTVTRLSSEKGKVNEVHYRNPFGKEEVAEAKIVVVACSAIESVRLLQLSALQSQDFERRIEQNDLLGKYFLTHAFGGASAHLPEHVRVDKSVALDSDWATDCCNTDAFLNKSGLWAGATIYNNTSDAALPLSLFRTMGAMDMDTLWHGLNYDLSLRGDKLIKYIDENFGRTISLSFMANQVPQKNNRIELHSTIKDKWNRPAAYINKTWHEHDKLLMDQLAGHCKSILEYSGLKVLGAGGSYNADNGLIRIANHVLGGARFGSDPSDSVLDLNCRAWEFENLYVTDGSFMPTSGSGNPTHTIEANAFRVSEIILKKLE